MKTTQTEYEITQADIITNVGVEPEEIVTPVDTRGISPTRAALSNEWLKIADELVEAGNFHLRCADYYRQIVRPEFWASHQVMRWHAGTGAGLIEQAGVCIQQAQRCVREASVDVEYFMGRK